ncbi:mitotic fidelity of chromosome transmission-related protein, partial [Elasticomyces elasticus]
MSPEPRKAEQPKATPPKAKPAPKTINRTQETTTQPNRINEQESVPKPRRPGRPPKAQRKDNEDTGEQRPAKKAKTSAAAAEQTSREVRTTGDPEIDHIVEDYASRKGGSKARSLHVLKREKLGENSLATTRSGRTVVKPLAFWKNEKCLFGEEGISEGRWIPCSTMTGVLRAEEEESEKKKSGKGRGRPKKSKKSKDVESDDEEEDEDVDDWEQEGGVLHGYIRKWDAETQAGVEEEEVLDIAYAPSGIETKDVKDSTFRFAKLLSSPFLGSGIVELPPGGVKRPKNSKKMHMVFYVCQGRVQIDISGVQFSAGKGCVFQIPRGNYYSFANAHGHDARLFFTQG